MDVDRARRPKTFFPRVNPMTRYDEQKFGERYRLPKATVRLLAANYEASGLCATRLDSRGGGLSAEERVRYKEWLKKLYLFDYTFVANIFKPCILYCRFVWHSDILRRAPTSV